MPFAATSEFFSRTEEIDHVDNKASVTYALGIDNSDTRKKPKASVGDLAHVIAKAGLSAIPTFGGPAAELFAAIIIPPLLRRRDEWVQSIADG